MDFVSLGSALAALVVVLATQLPKIMAGFKRDKLDATFASTQMNIVDGIQHSYEKQILSLTERLNRMEARVNDMDETIHVQAIKVTRLIVVIIQLKSILMDFSIPIPPHIKEEIDKLTVTPIVQEETK